MSQAYTAKSRRRLGMPMNNPNPGFRMESIKKGEILIKCHGNVRDSIEIFVSVFEESEKGGQ